MALPQIIQQTPQLLNFNNEVKALRTEFSEAVSKINTSAFNAKDALGNVIERLLLTIETFQESIEGAVIPKDSASDFDDRLVTLDDFADFDTIAYYNGLTRLLSIYHGVLTALVSIKDVKHKSLAPPNATRVGFLDTLNTNEFIEQGYQNPVMEVEEAFSYYITIQGDTLQGIAAKQLFDATRWTEIAQANNLKDSDLIDGTVPVGTTIKIPGGNAVANIRSTFNLVYEPPFDGTSQKEIDRFNFGRDYETFEKRKLISAAGDFKLIEGIPGVVQNIQNRFDNRKGNLNPLNPEWGLTILNNTGKVPFVIFLDRVLSDMESQAAADPRVLSATINRKELKLSGDRLDVSMVLRLIGGQESKESFGVPQV